MDITFCEVKKYNIKMVDEEIIIEGNEKPEENIEKPPNMITLELSDNEEEDVDSVDFKLEMTKKVKLLSLNKMGLSILTNTYNMREYQRQELQRIMKTYEDKTTDEIIKEFNFVVNMEIFDNPKVDISKLPIYDI